MLPLNVSHAVAEMSRLISPQDRVGVLKTREVGESSRGHTIVQRIWRNPSDAQIAFYIVRKRKLIQRIRAQPVEPKIGIVNQSRAEIVGQFRLTFCPRESWLVKKPGNGWLVSDSRRCNE